MTDPSESPNIQDSIILRGLVTDRVIDEGTWKARQYIVLEKEPGGQFLALHGEAGRDLDVTSFMGKWVEVEGTLWFQSITARSITEV